MATAFDDGSIRFDSSVAVVGDPDPAPADRHAPGPVAHVDDRLGPACAGVEPPDGVVEEHRYPHRAEADRRLGRPSANGEPLRDPGRSVDAERPHRRGGRDRNHAAPYPKAAPSVKSSNSNGYLRTSCGGVRTRWRQRDTSWSPLSATQTEPPPTVTAGKTAPNPGTCATGSWMLSSAAYSSEPASASLTTPPVGLATHRCLPSCRARLRPAAYAPELVTRPSLRETRYRLLSTRLVTKTHDPTASTSPGSRPTGTTPVIFPLACVDPHQRLGAVPPRPRRGWRGRAAPAATSAATSAPARISARRRDRVDGEPLEAARQPPARTARPGSRGALGRSPRSRVRGRCRARPRVAAGTARTRGAPPHGCRRRRAPPSAGGSRPRGTAPARSPAPPTAPPAPARPTHAGLGEHGQRAEPDLRVLAALLLDPGRLLARQEGPPQERCRLSGLRLRRLEVARRERPLRLLDRFRRRDHVDPRPLGQLEPVAAERAGERSRRRRPLRRAGRAACSRPLPAPCPRSRAASRPRAPRRARPAERPAPAPSRGRRRAADPGAPGGGPRRAAAAAARSHPAGDEDLQVQRSNHELDAILPRF